MTKDVKWKFPIDITKEQWLMLLQDKEIVKTQDLELLKLIYANEDYMATALQIAKMLNMIHHAPLNSQVGRLGKRIANKLGIKAPKKITGDGVNWWNVPFWGAETEQGCYWILRPELREALDQLINLGVFEVELEINLPEEIIIANEAELDEGAEKHGSSKVYQRNALARSICIKHYGYKCVICGFDFEKKYGIQGKNVIHVHHLKPLSKRKGPCKVNPIKDLRPVCPNCHLIIHKRNPIYSIEEVINMLEDTKF